MKIGIVGCGLNSDYHIKFSRSYPGVEIVGLVDKDEHKAKECSEKHGIKNVYSSTKNMVDHERPDVIHILTPPKTHFVLGKEAIESGCHVLIEKPMTLNYKDSEALYRLADQYGVRLCTMHNHLFDPCMMAAREIIGNGSLGKVVNIESYYGINSQIPAFRDYPAPNVLPWLYELPGSVYQDFMPHPLYILLEYTGKPKEIKVMTQSRGSLPHNMVDEIRILVNGVNALGTLTFSLAAKPHLHYARIYGTQMMVEVDFNTMTTVTHPVSSLPKAAQKATFNLSESWQLLNHTVSNVWAFLTGKLKPYQGMRTLIHLFYDSIKGDTETPINKERALYVISTMEEIWRQIDIPVMEFKPIPEDRDPVLIKHKEKILVTGGTGFLGKRLVEMLVEEGYPVRVLARKLSNIDDLVRWGVAVYFGDVADKKSLEAAFNGMNVVIHAAAGTSGDKKDGELGTILGTQNVLDLCREKKITKLVYVSSCSVYGVADFKNGKVVSEEASLERFPERRGDYSASKQQAEKYAMDAMKRSEFPIVILRPGTIYGPKGDLFSPMMGFSIANRIFLVIGDGKFELPFVFIDNVVNTIMESARKDEANNQIFNVLDQERMTKKDYVNRVIKKIYPRAWIIYLPYFLMYLITWAQEIVFGILKRRPILTRYRLVSSQRKISYDISKIIKKLNWTPKVSIIKATEKIIDGYK